MSSNASVNIMNNLLKDYMFQVVGSTPESMRDVVKSSTLRSEPEVASLLATLAIYATAVNKATMETFLAKPEMQRLRPIINAAFTVSGKPNMTGLTLLGHCVLTTSFADNIVFCKEFRNKMGQNHLWAGNLNAGNLSDTQRKILQQKQSITPESTAKLLGSGFLKYTGIVAGQMTEEESEFWGENYSARVDLGRSYSGYDNGGGTAIGSNSNDDSVRGYQTHSRTASGNIVLTGADNKTYKVPADIVDYYKKNMSDNEQRLISSIEKRGLQNFIDSYRDAMVKNPTGKGLSGGSIIG